MAYLQNVSTPVLGERWQNDNMEFAYLPGSTFLSNISTKLSLSGRDCSWKKPSACPEKVFFFFFISYLFCKHVFRITFAHEVDDKNWCVDLPISWATMPLIQHPRPRVMFCCLPVLPSCEEHLSIYLTIIPRARVGSESKAHKTEGRMG